MSIGTTSSRNSAPHCPGGAASFAVAAVHEPMSPSELSSERSRAVDPPAPMLPTSTPAPA
jgi:hypothetical protein